MTVFDPDNMKEGIGRIYYGNPAGSATPDVMPADNVAYGNPGGNWQVLGATQGGFTFDNTNPEETPQYADHMRQPFGYFPGDFSPTVSFNLLETDSEKVFTVSNIGTLETVAPGAGTYGHTSFKLTSARRPEVAVLIEAFDAAGNPWRGFYPRARTRISGASTHQKQNPKLIPVMVMATPADDTEVPEWRDVHPPTS